jgi:NADH-quinone oxidoreductase subunit N
LPLGAESFLTTLRADVLLALPEVILAGAMCVLLLLPFVSKQAWVQAWGTLAGLGAALIATALRLTVAGSAFHGMLAVDPLSQFFKVLLLLFVMCVVVQWLIFTGPQTPVRDAPDFFCLLLGATLGMSLMASANHLLLIFIATEIASLSSFALAGFRKRTRLGAESALKYVVFGAAASSIALYGMSLIYGSTGSLSLPAIGAALSSGSSPLLVIGLIGLLVGVAFKLSAVPMHFWCPDVFEAAPLPVTTFLSVASKGAALVLLIRLITLFTAPAAGAHPPATGIAIAIAILGAVTATWGNLLAYHQHQIKRLLAYSSIAQAGYMVMAAAAVTAKGAAAGALLFYLLIYLFMNLGAFTVAGLIAQRIGTEDIRRYPGLRRRSPLLVAAMTVFLLSLFGMPGLGGFVGKIFLGLSMLDLGPGGFVLVAVLLVNTLLSLYFYLRPVYFMVFADESEPQSQPSAAGATSWAGGLMAALCVVMVVWTGVLPSIPQSWASDFATVMGAASPHADPVAARVP